MTIDPDPCITCGDAAVEASVVDVRGPTAVVEIGGRLEEVAVELVAPVGVDDRLLCHAGIALVRLGKRGVER